ncbi:MAG: chemotaxis protein CheW [Verrucomicrobia bacterium]|nr:chemotaxis protein CheW [Verrucomicrobiota bacterium]
MNAALSATGTVVHLVALRAGQRFSLPVATVREVLALPELEPVPLAPRELLGSFQLRGEIIPALLTDSLLSIGSENDAPKVLALLCDGDATVALAFDRVLSVMSVDPAALIPPPLARQRPWMTHLHVDARYQLVTVLDGPVLVAALVAQLQFSLSPS